MGSRAVTILGFFYTVIVGTSLGDDIIVASIETLLLSVKFIKFVYFVFCPINHT